MNQQLTSSFVNTVTDWPSPPDHSWSCFRATQEENCQKTGVRFVYPAFCLHTFKFCVCVKCFFLVHSGQKSKLGCHIVIAHSPRPAEFSDTSVIQVRCDVSPCGRSRRSAAWCRYPGRRGHRWSRSEPGSGPRRWRWARTTPSPLRTGSRSRAWRTRGRSSGCARSAGVRTEAGETGRGGGAGLSQ